MDDNNFENDFRSSLSAFNTNNVYGSISTNPNNNNNNNNNRQSRNNPYAPGYASAANTNSWGNAGGNDTFSNAGNTISGVFSSLTSKVSSAIQNTNAYISGRDSDQDLATGSGNSHNRGASGGNEEGQSLLGSIRDRTAGVLGIGGTREADEDCCGLSRFQRYGAFMVSIALGTFCLFIAFFSLPMIVLFPSKFASSFSMGSLLIFTSTAFLRGPRTYLKQLISKERLSFTLVYVGSLIGTLYFSLVEHSYFFCILFIIIQVVALGWYVSSYIPGMNSGMGRMTRAMLPI